MLNNYLPSHIHSETFPEDEMIIINHLEKLNDDVADINTANTMCKIINSELAVGGENFSFSILDNSKEGYFIISSNCNYGYVNISNIHDKLKNVHFKESCQVDYFNKDPVLFFRVKKAANRNEDLKINYGNFGYSKGGNVNMSLKLDGIELLDKLKLEKKFCNGFKKLTADVYLSLVPTELIEFDKLKINYKLVLKQEQDNLVLYIKNCCCATNNLFLIDNLIKEFQIKCLGNRFRYNYINLHCNLDQNNRDIMIRFMNVRLISNKRKRKREVDENDELEKDRSNKKMKLIDNNKSH